MTADKNIFKYVFREPLIMGILFTYFAYLIINPSFSNLDYNYPIFESIAHFYKGAPGLQNDYFVNKSAEWNAYYIFTVVLYLIPEWSWQYFYLSYWLLSVFIYYVAMRLSVADIQDSLKQNLIVFVSLVIILFSSKVEISIFGKSVNLFGGFIVGDNTLVYDFAQPQMLSCALVMAILICHIYTPERFEKTRGSVTAGLLLGVCGLFHVHMYILGVVIITFSTFVWQRKSVKSLVLLLLVSIVVGSYNFVPLALEIFRQSDIQGAFSYIDISGYFRHPHHLVPSTFSKLTWLLFAFFVCLTSLALCIKSEDPLRMFIIRVIGPIALLLCVIGYVFVEIYQVQIVGKLQLYRILLVFKFLAVTYIVKQVLLKDSKLLQFVLASILVASAAIFAARFTQFSDNSGYVDSARNMLNVIPQEVPETETVINFIPHDDMFISSVASVAKRSVFFDAKRFPFGGGYNEWFEKYAKNLNVDVREIGDIKSFHHRKDHLLSELKFDDVQQIMKNLKIDYALVDENLKIPPSVLIADIGSRRLINIANAE